MSKDSDLVMMKNICERLKVDNRMLRERIKENAKKQAEIDARNKSDIKHFRELCEMILAKDKNEMVLGQEYSWDSLSNSEICQKAVKAYINYNERKTAGEKRLLTEYRKRGEVIDGLKLQFSRLLNGEKLSTDEASQFLSDPSKVIQEEKAKEKIDNTFKRAESDGRITAIIEEDSDILKGELEDTAPLMKSNIGYQLTPGAPKIFPAPEKLKKKNEMKKEMIERDMYKVQELVDKFTPGIWLIIEVIGTYGCSLRKDISNKCLELSKERKLNIKESNLVRDLQTMANMPNVITITKVTLPSGMVMVIQLDRIGITIFENQFEKSPVKSEAKMIIEEHDNLTHGYGIFSLAQALYEAKRYKKINVMNKKHAIEVVVDNQKTTYVPDLICVDDDNNVFYYEYELAKHNLRNFRFKCNKMSKVSSVLRFVVPNKDVAGDLKTKIDNWISEVGKNRLKHTKVLVHTYKNLIEDGPPTLEYDLSVSETPIVDKTSKK